MFDKFKGKIKETAQTVTGTVVAAAARVDWEQIRTDVNKTTEEVKEQAAIYAAAVKKGIDTTAEELKATRPEAPKSEVKGDELKK